MTDDNNSKAGGTALHPTTDFIALYCTTEIVDDDSPIKLCCIVPPKSLTMIAL